MGVAAFFAGGSLSSGVREDRSNRWVIAALSVIGLVAGYLPALTDRLNFWTIDGDAVRWLGVALFAVGGALRLWPVYVLGHRFSGLVAIQPGHALVTTGIYSVIRHPSYLGLFVNALGWALVFRSAVGVLLALLDLGAAGRPHRCGRAAAAFAIRQRIRRLSRPHLAAHSGGVVGRAGDGGARRPAHAAYRHRRDFRGIDKKPAKFCVRGAPGDGARRPGGWFRRIAVAEEFHAKLGGDDGDRGGSGARPMPSLSTGGAPGGTSSSGRPSLTLGRRSRNQDRGRVEGRQGARRCLQGGRRQDPRAEGEVRPWGNLRSAAPQPKPTAQKPPPK